MPPQPGIILILLCLFLFVSSCKKLLPEKEKEIIPEEFPTGAPGGGGSTGCVEALQADTDTIETQTVLGAKLQNNPYSVTVMQQAAVNLYGSSAGIAVNKLYVRVKPADVDQLIMLEEMNIPLFDYPLDYEIIKEGDYFPQEGIGPEDMPWFYTVVDANFNPPPGIQFEILEQVFIPNFNLELEAEAFRITGNPLNNLCDGGTDYRLPNPCTYPSYIDCDAGTGGGGDPSILNPAGVINVWDNNLNTPRPLRQVLIVAKNFLKIETVYTDNNGQFRCTKNFIRVSVSVRFRNNHSKVRGIRGARLWQLFFPVEAHIGRFREVLNNINRTIFRNDWVRSRGMRHWVAATVHNNVLEFSDMANPDGLNLPNNQIKIFIAPGANAAAAPMFVQRGPLIPELHRVYFFRKFIANPAVGNFFELQLSFIPNNLSRLVDIVYGYNRVIELLDSDDISETLFHELTHAGHYAKVGDNWWHDFVSAELIEGANNDGTQWDIYGQGNTERSAIIALAESWAFHYGRILADNKYGILSSRQFEQGFEYRNGSIWQFGSQVAITGLNAHLNLLEDFSPARLNDPYSWIPQGMFLDLIDNRNDIAFNRVNLDDQVVGYTNQQFFSALDFDISNLQAYRTRLLQENNNSQAAGVNAIFNFYGY